MLQIKTVDQSTLALLKSLMELPCLSEYRLVGGTSLALQLGHRKSIDIDLFGATSFNEINLQDELKTLGEVHSLLTTKYIRTYTIESVKVDIVNYTYSWIDNMQLEDGKWKRIQTYKSKTIDIFKYTKYCLSTAFCHGGEHLGPFKFIQLQSDGIGTIAKLGFQITQIALGAAVQEELQQ